MTTPPPMPQQNPLLAEIHSHVQSMSPGAQAAIKQAIPTTGISSPPDGGAVRTNDQPIQDPQAHPAVPPMQSAPAQHTPLLGPQTESPHVASTILPPPTPGAAPSGTMQAPPPISGPQPSAIQRDQAQATDLSRGSGISQIHSKIEDSGFGQAHPLLGKVLGWGAQIPATLADTAASAVAPEITRTLPGTEYHHEALVHQNQRQTGQDTENSFKEAQTANELDKPEVASAKNELAQTKLQQGEHDAQSKLEANLREHGLKTNPETGRPEPLTYEEMSEPQQAAYDLKGSQTGLAEANEQLAKAKNDPNSPLYKEAMDKIASIHRTQDIALQRLGLSREQFQMRSRGTDMQGTPFNGAMLGDNGEPIGTAFQQNVRPTGQERNKADLANSAATQINDMKSIVQKHPDFFGPGFGQSTQFKNWIGSGDPDAKRFVAARTIAADHLAGTFGGRSEYALQALDDALGQFKDNPKAALAGLDQLSGANKSFQKAGTVRTAGSNAAAAAGGGTQTFHVGSETYNIPADKIEAFKKEFPNAK